MSKHPLSTLISRYYGYAVTGLCLIALAGCVSTDSPHGFAMDDDQTVASSSEIDKGVEQIRQHAEDLAQQVVQGHLTKVQAAQLLNRFRLQWIGSNAVDDAVYTTYLRSAVLLQSGAIDAAQAHKLLRDELESWSARWRSMKERPKNPSFTNFLLSATGMPLLRHDVVQPHQ